MRKARLRFLATALLCTLLPARAFAAPADAAGENARPAVSAQRAILLDAASGRVVYEKDADSRAYMASTTKVMTALLTLTHCSPEEIVTVPAEAAGVEGSTAYLTRGERLSVKDLLYALMLSSGNDAAVALAMHVAGSTEEFAKRMNARAEALGCTDTHFTNPNGLPDAAHYTTARDLAKIAAEAMRLSAFRTIVGTTYYQTESGDTNRTFKNKNRVLWQYEGGCGVKTGFTKAAGRCLVFAAERDGMTMLGCLLNAPQMWEDAYALLNYGFATLENTRLVDAEKPLTSVAVEDGAKKRLAVYPICDILYPCKRDGSDEIRFEMVCADALTAPVRAGETVGALTLYINGEAAGSTELIVTEQVLRTGFLTRLYEIVADFAA